MLPVMDPPPPVDFAPAANARIQQVYSEFPTMFAKELARRQQLGLSVTPLPIMGHPNPNLKRDRPEEAPSDMMNKRRHIGENKAQSMMMPPPASLPMTSPVTHPTTNQFSLPINGAGTSVMSQQPPQLTDSAMAPSTLPAGLMNTQDAQLAASNRERMRQAQIRAAQQNAARQMSPPSGPGPGMNAGQPQLTGHGMPMPNNVNAAAGPSNLSTAANSNPNVQQCLQLLQQPNHAFIAYMNRLVPNFQGLPVQLQVQKMLQAQVCPITRCQR